MKLFYTPGACSLSPHIALLEAGAPFEAIKVGRDKQTSDGRDFLAINPYGYVPALELDDGEVLTEGPAIVQYIADRWPAAELAPPNLTIERYRLQSELGFINSEVHKTVSGLFNGALTDDERARIVEKVDTRLTQLSKKMEGHEWIVNDRFSVADIYLFVVTRWFDFLKIDLGRWPVIAAHHARVRARPATQAALVAEHLA
jgi:glutathione S-transferase